MILIRNEVCFLGKTPVNVRINAYEVLKQYNKKQADLKFRYYSNPETISM
jgi:hypothetical protein